MNDFELMKLKEKSIPVSTLREYFSYDGINLIWKRTTTNRVKRGAIAGSKTVSGYLQVGFLGVDIKVHRIIWALVHGYWPELIIDHKDGNRLNNRIENLRETNFNGNLRNMRIPSHNTSGIKGVGFCKQTKKWTCSIHVNNKKIWLGRYNTKEEAAKVYAEASKKYHGEFGRVK